MWSNQNIVAPIMGWQTFNNGDTLTTTGVDGDWYLYVKVSDNIENKTETSSNRFRLDNAAPGQPTIGAVSPIGYSFGSWASQNVTINVTDGIDTGSGFLKSQYKISQTGTWIDYTVPFTVSTSDAVYAKTIDKVANESAITGVVVNIDKQYPTVTYTPNGSETYAKTASTKVTVVDQG